MASVEHCFMDQLAPPSIYEWIVRSGIDFEEDGDYKSTEQVLFARFNKDRKIPFPPDTEVLNQGKFRPIINGFLDCYPLGITNNPFALPETIPGFEQRMIFEFAYHLKNVLDKYRLCPATGKFYQPYRKSLFLNRKEGQRFRNHYRNQVLTHQISNPEFTLHYRFVPGWIEIQDHRLLSHFSSRSELKSLVPYKFSIWLDGSDVHTISELTESP